MQVLWLVSKEYILILREMDQIIFELELAVIKSTDNNVLYDLIGLNNGLIYFKTAIQGNSGILKKIEEDIKGKSYTVEERSLLTDVMVKHKQALVLVGQYKGMVENLSTMLSSVINNNMNIVMKRLTGWTILLTIPTIVAGFWGMNVFLPFSNHPFGLIIIIAITLLISYFIYKWLKFNDYM